jgi:hypothetical protein
MMLIILHTDTQYNNDTPYNNTQHEIKIATHIKKHNEHIINLNVGVLRVIILNVAIMRVVAPLFFAKDRVIEKAAQK